MNEQMQDNRRSVWTWLFNPFHYVAGGRALAAGLVLMAVTSALAMLSHTHFDGVLDLHPGAPAPWWVFWIESPIDWLTLALVLLAGGKLLSKSHIRIIDVLGTQALARFPAVLAAAIQLPPQVQDANRKMLAALMQGMRPGSPGLSSIQPVDMLLFTFMGIISTVVIIWMIYLMYRAFAVACNVSGAKAIIAFVVLLLLAEILSKFILGGLLAFCMSHGYVVPAEFHL